MDGKVAVITGATSGIGEASVDEFVKEGCKVVFCGRNEKLGVAIQARQPPDTAIFVRADVIKEEDIVRVVQTAMDAWGRIDILWNNAGGPSNPPGTPARYNIETINKEIFDYGMWYLLGSVMMATKHVSPIMRKQGCGSIINNSSVSVLQGNHGDPIYSAAKAGVTTFSKVTAFQLGPFGIRCNAISPGSIATPIFWGGHTQGRPDMTEEQSKKVLARMEKGMGAGNPLTLAPNRKYVNGDPRYIAHAAVYLGSDESEWVTGTDFVVDAGANFVRGEHSGPRERMRKMFEDRDARRAKRQEGGGSAPASKL